MSKKLGPEGTTFAISRQAALVGKVSFPLPNESPLGGEIIIQLIGNDVKDWLEAATWHEGRDNVPRRVGDDLSMDANADSVTWH